MFYGGNAWKSVVDVLSLQRWRRSRSGGEDGSEVRKGRKGHVEMKQGAAGGGKGAWMKNEHEQTIKTKDV